MHRQDPDDDPKLPRDAFEDTAKLDELRRKALERMRQDEQRLVEIAPPPPQPPSPDPFTQTVYGAPPLDPGSARVPAPVYGGPPIGRGLSSPPARNYGRLIVIALIFFVILAAIAIFLQSRSAA